MINATNQAEITLLYNYTSMPSREDNTKQDGT